MNNGIIVDVGFKPDIEQFINDINTEFKKIDFSELMGLSDAFESQEKEIKKKLSELKSLIDKSFNGVVGEQPIQEMKDLQKSVKELGGSLDALVKSMPNDMAAKYNQNLHNISNTINEVTQVSKNATTSLEQMSKAVDNNIKSSNPEKLKELIDSYRQITSTLEKMNKVFEGKGVNKVGQVQYGKADADLSHIVNRMRSTYELLMDAQDEYIKESESKEKKELLDKAKRYSDLASEMSLLINTYNRLGFNSKEPIIDFGATFGEINVQDIEADYEEDFSELRSFFNNQLNSLEREYSKFSESSISDYFVQKKGDTTKSLHIQLPLNISTTAPMLSKDAIKIIQDAQQKVAENGGLEVGIRIISDYKSNANQKVLKDIANQLDNIDDEEIREKIQALINKMSQDINNTLLFNVTLNAEKAKKEVTKFKEDLSDTIAEIEKWLPPIAPEIELTEENKEKFQKQLDIAAGGFTVNLVVNDQEVNGSDPALAQQEKKTLDTETKFLIALAQRVERVKKAVNDKSLAFIDEGSIVEEVINGELDKINQLIDYLVNVENELDSLKTTYQGTFNNENISLTISPQLDNLFSFSDTSSQIQKELKSLLSSLFENGLLDNKKFDQIIQFYLDIDSTEFDFKFKNILKEIDELENKDIVINIGSSISKGSFSIPIDSTISSIKKGTNRNKQISDLEVIAHAADLYKLYGKSADLFEDLLHNASETIEKLKEVGISIDSFISAMKDTGFIGVNGEPIYDIAKGGDFHSEGAIGAKYAFFGRNEGISIERAKIRQQDINELADLGVNIARVVLIKARNKVDGSTGLDTNRYFEVQEKVPGQNFKEMLSNIETLSKEEFIKFFQDAKLILEKGLAFDIGGNNILYDKDKGFYPIDLADKDGFYPAMATNLEELFNYIKSNLKGSSVISNLVSAYKEVNSQSASSIISKRNERNSSSKTIENETSKMEEFEKAINRVTEAINKKTEAIKNEGVVSNSVIGSEIEDLSPLESLEKSYNSFKNYSDRNELESEEGAKAAISYYTAYKNALEAKVNKKDLKSLTVGKMGNLFTGKYNEYKKGNGNIDTSGLDSQIQKYSEYLEELSKPEIIKSIDAISQAISDLLISSKDNENLTQLLKALNNSLNALSNNKSAEKIKTFSDNLNKIGEAFNQLNSSDNNFVTSISALLDKGEELKLLGEVLKSSSKQILSAQKSINNQKKYDEAAAYLASNENKISIDIDKLISGNGNTSLYKKMEATTEGLVKVITLVKDATNAYKEYTYTVDTHGKIEQRSVSQDSPSLAKKGKEWEDYQKLKSLYIEGATNLGKEGESFSPASENWEELKKKVHEFGIELNNVQKIIRNVDELGQESFQIFTNLSRITVGMDSQGVLFQRDEVFDKEGDTKDLIKYLDNLKKSMKSAFSGSSSDIEKAGIALESFSDQLSYIKDVVNSQDNLINMSFYEEYFQSILKDITTNVTDKLGETFDNKNRIPEVKQQFEELKLLADQVNKIDFNNISQEDIDLIKQYAESFRQLNSVMNNKDSLFAKNDSVSKLLKKINKSMQDNSSMSTKLKNQYQALSDELTSFNGNVPIKEFSKINNKFLELEATIYKTHQTGKSFFDMFKSDIIQKSAGTLAQYFSLYDIIRYTKEMATTVKEYNTQLTEMRKVSNESISTLKEYQATTFDVADAIGTTAAQVQSSTADWLRLGEELDQAAESAKASTILFNVSEFESIDEATESLTAMSQAYKDLDKMQIIDVLNEVGNNYSISTEGLATALQNAAAVLYTQGNDLAEAVALITAGNAITQDTDKTGAGIRTISLRIAGTEEAKDELVELGEDVDDFVVQTTSKTDKIIRDYTAVASNAYKGISVLDENGNLRNTYDILLDISKIYKEIQEEDKKAGTNRANALVETLTGKNRSNIASSILLNPELLENVYNSANNASGSAQEELEKYNESLEAAVTRFENQLDHLQTTFLDSEFATQVVDLGTEFLRILTEIIDKFGSLGTIATAVGGVIGAKYGDFFQMFSQFQTSLLNSNRINEFAEQVTELFNSGDLLDNIDELTESFSDLDENILNAAEDLSLGSSSLDDFKANAKSATLAGNAFVTTLKSIAINMGVMIAVNLAIKGITWLVDNLIETAEEAQEKIEAAKDEISKINSELDALEAKDELTSGDLKRIDYLQRRLDLQERYVASKEKEQRLKKYEDGIIPYITNGANYLRNIGFNEFKNTIPDKIFEGQISNFKNNQKEILDYTQRLSGLNEGDDFYTQYLNHLKYLQGEQDELISKLETSISSNEGKYGDALNKLDEISNDINSGDLSGSALTNAKSSFEYWVRQAEKYKNAIYEAQKLLVDPRLSGNISQISDRNIDDYMKLYDYTSKFSADQIDLWVKVTNGARNAEEAIGLYEKALEGVEDKYVKLATFKDIFNLDDTTFGDLNTKVDELQNAFNVLKDAMNTYNETGKFTIDQMQSIVGLGDEYLKYLIDENGELKLNEEALKQVTMARIAEMKAQAIEQYIENINAIKNETDAQNFLKKQNLDTASSYTTLAKSAIAAWTAIKSESSDITEETSRKMIERIEKDSYRLDKIFDNLDIDSIYTGSGSGSNKSSESVQKFDYIEIAISRIQRSITNLGKIVSSTFKTWSSRNSAIGSELSEITHEINLQQTAYQAYINAANSIDLSSDYKSKIQNGAMQIETIKDSKLAEKVQDYQDLYEKALACSDAIIDLRENLAELAKQRFDNVVSQYDNQLSLIEHRADMIQAKMDQTEARGYLISKDYYSALIDEENQKLSNLQSERDELLTQMTNAMSNGVEQYSESWYDMQESINSVEKAIEDANKQLIEFRNTMRQIDWDKFNMKQDRYSKVGQEADFYINLLSNAKRYNEFANLTNEGMATLGLYGQQYNTYLYESEQYAKEIANIQKELANDPYNTTLIDRYYELMDAQRSAIESSEQMKQSIKDLIAEGYQKQLEILQKLIDTQKNLMSESKSWYDYQKKVTDQTKNLATLRKQMSAFQNDLSEEGRLRVQKLQVQIQDAEQELAETEWDHYISETGKLLDNLYSEYETIFNERLDDMAYIMRTAIEAINNNSIDIAQTLESTSNSVGYTMTQEMRSIWAESLSASDQANALRVQKMTEIIRELQYNGQLTEAQANYLVAQLGSGTAEETANFNKVLEKMVENKEISRATANTIAEGANNTSQTIRETGKDIKDVVANFQGNLQGSFTNALTSTNEALNSISVQIDNMYRAFGEYAQMELQKSQTANANTSSTAISSGSSSNSDTSSSSSKGTASNSTSSSTPSDTKKVDHSADIAKLQKQIAENEKKIAEWTKNINNFEKSITNAQQTQANLDRARRAGMPQSSYETALKKAQLEESAARQAKALNEKWISEARSQITTWSNEIRSLRGYRKGGKNLAAQLAWTQEDGQEIILSPSRNAVLTDLAQGDAVIDAKKTENLLKWAEHSPFELGFKMPNISGLSSSNNSNTFTYNVSIPIDHVQDYEDFMNQMRNDGKFEKLVQSMTIDRVAGNSSLSKNKFKW